MYPLLRILVGLSALWAAGALLYQFIVARGGGRRDYSRRAGNPLRGMVYNFTVAMTPGHKESVSRHPGKFALGMLMHAGTVVALLNVLVLAIRGDAGAWMLKIDWPLSALGLVCGLVLMIRRATNPVMRGISVPDDGLAIAATCLLLLLALLASFVAGAATWLMAYAVALFVYLPLGKLRHALFFFIARGDYGRRLGYRGVYPPAAETK